MNLFKRNLLILSLRLKASKKKNFCALLPLQRELRSQKGHPAVRETHRRGAIRPPAESPLDVNLVGEIEDLAGTILEILS